MCLIPNNPLWRPLGSLFRFYAWIYLFNSPFTPLTTRWHTHTRTHTCGAAGGECEGEGRYPRVPWELDIIQYNKRKTEERRGGEIFLLWCKTPFIDVYMYVCMLLSGSTTDSAGLTCQHMFAGAEVKEKPEQKKSKTGVTYGWNSFFFAHLFNLKIKGKMFSSNLDLLYFILF